MTKPRRSRSLTAEERRLWAQVARGIVPIKGRTRPAEPETLPGPAPAAPPVPVPLRAAPKALPPSPALPPLSPVERKTLLALKRGSRSVDAVIDLHGMRQEQAHAALLGFLLRSQRTGHQLLLVITGKGGAAGGAGSGHLFEERGVLRRMVPHWLRLPDLRPLVVGFEEAAPQHGGSGALYVRLRKGRGS